MEGCFRLTSVSTVTRPGRKFGLSSPAALLAWIYVCLLAGSASLSRLGGPDVTLRLVGLPVLIIFCLLWRATPIATVRAQSAASYMAVINLVFVYLMMSSLWAPPGSENLEGVASVGVMAILINLAAWVMSRTHSRILDQLWLVIFATSLVFLLGALIAGPGLQGRYAAFGGGPNVFVRVMLLGMIASLAIYLIYDFRWGLLGVPTFLVGALLSGSRGGILALGIFLIVLVPLVRRLRWDGSVRLLVIFLTSATAAFALTPIHIRRLFYERFVVLSIQQPYDSGRSAYYSAAVELFKQRPIYGWGLGGYTERTGLHYAHNLFLAFAAEGGLVGIALLLVCLVAPVLTIVRGRRPLATSAIMGLVASLCIFVASLFSGDYYDSRYFWFFLIYAVYASRGADRAGG